MKKLLVAPLFMTPHVEPAVPIRTVNSGDYFDREDTGWHRREAVKEMWQLICYAIVILCAIYIYKKILEGRMEYISRERHMFVIVGKKKATHEIEEFRRLREECHRASRKENGTTVMELNSEIIAKGFR